MHAVSLKEIFEANKNYSVYLLCVIILVYRYINSNEIPGELSRENMISSQVKITCYFHM